MGYIGKEPASVALTSSDITDGIITTDKVAGEAITTAKLAAGAVSNAKIAADTVNSANVDSTISTTGKSIAFTLVL